MFLAFATRCVAFLNVSESMNGSLPAQCEVARPDPDTTRVLSGLNPRGALQHSRACVPNASPFVHATCPTGARVVSVWVSPVLRSRRLHRRRETTTCKPRTAAALSLPRLSAREFVEGSLADRPSKVGLPSGETCAAPGLRLRPDATGRCAMLS